MGFEITRRDIAIVERVARHRFLRSSHLASLIPGSPNVIGRRIRHLCRAGFLERMPVRQSIRRHGGSAHHVFGLGSEGGALLKERSSLAPARLKWLQRHRDRRESVRHALMVSDFLVALEQSARAARVEYLSPERLREHVFGDWKQFAWRVTIEHKRAPVPCAVIPDEAFALRNPGSGQLDYYFLEADRGTMPVKRRNLTQTSFHRKLAAYYTSWEKRIPHSLYRLPSFRTITITTNIARIENIIDANREITGGHGSRLFLFTDTAALAGHSDVLELPFRTGRDEVVTLFE